MKNALKILRANWGKTLVSLFILGWIGMAIYSIGEDIYYSLQPEMTVEELAELFDSLEFPEEEETGGVRDPFTGEHVGPQITETPPVEVGLPTEEKEVPEKPVVSDRITAKNILALTNYERAKVGLPALIENELLTEAAEKKADDMDENDYFEHEPEGRLSYIDFIKNEGYVYSIIGENLARDFSDVQSVVDAWIESPGHRANVLSSRYTETGISVEGGFVVQMFGNPR